MPVPPLDNHTDTCALSLKRLFTRSPPATIQTPSSRFAQPRLDTKVAEATHGEMPPWFTSCRDLHSSTIEHGLDLLPPYVGATTQFDIKDALMKTIANEVDMLNPALRKLSLSIHGTPEVASWEQFAHKTLTEFMQTQGFMVTRQYLGFNTAWRAEFIHGEGGRTIGINSEMDALPRIGHACGHNLIAVSGVGVAVAIKAALLAHNISGKIVLLGTPAEEDLHGKVMLLERGAYDGMHACLMCHPMAGAANSLSTSTALAMQVIKVEFTGHSAHAGNAPWEGANALDAAFLAYSSVAVLRQQIKPDHRISGVMEQNEFSANVIPDRASMLWSLRAPDPGQLQILRERVKARFHGASVATGCHLDMRPTPPIDNLRQNAAMTSHFGMHSVQGLTGISKDFGNVSQELPSLHPMYAIPTLPNGGIHTPAFTTSARSIEAHQACMKLTKGLAWTGLLVLKDDAFYAKVKEEYESPGDAHAA